MLFGDALITVIGLSHADLPHAIEFGIEMREHPLQSFQGLGASLTAAQCSTGEFGTDGLASGVSR